MDQNSIIKGFLNANAPVNERAMYLSLMYEQFDVISKSIDFIVIMVIRAYQEDESGGLLVELLSELCNSMLHKTEIDYTGCSKNN